MSQRPIMDAGPGINFLSVNKERLLFSTLGALSVPEAVETEILRKAAQDKRFSAAERVWKRLPERLMEVLSDDVTDELSRSCPTHQRCSVRPARPPGKDLGETHGYRARFSWWPMPEHTSSSSLTTAEGAVPLRQKLDGGNVSKRTAIPWGASLSSTP